MAEQSYLLSKDFWAAAIERSIKTGAQAALASGALDAVNILHIDWHGVAILTLVAMLASVLTSIASGSVGDKGGPSLGPEKLKGEVSGNSNSKTDGPDTSAGTETNPKHSR